MKPYRLKHKPTGLYYKPTSSSNLSKKGKVYTTSASALTYYNKDIVIELKKATNAYKQFREMLQPYVVSEDKTKINYHIPRTHFELEEL